VRIAVTDPAGFDADADLAGARLGIRQVHRSERSAELRELDGAHRRLRDCRKAGERRARRSSMSSWSATRGAVSRMLDAGSFVNASVERINRSPPHLDERGTGVAAILAASGVYAARRGERTDA
jgi:hypothetical protein